MDKAIAEYKKRRQKRMDAKNGAIVYRDSVDDFKKRRKERLEARMDAGIGWAYGLAKSKGIDTTGMSPKEVFEALEKAGETVGSKPGENAGNAGNNKLNNGNNGNNNSTNNSRETYLKNFAKGKPVGDGNGVKKGDVISDGERAYVVSEAGARRFTLSPVSEKDNELAGEKINKGSLVSRDKLSDMRVVGHQEQTADRHEYKPTNREIQKLKSKGIDTDTYSPGFATNGGVGFPAPKDGAVYDMSTLKEVNRLAAEGGKDKAYDKTVLNLTPKDLVYQKDPDGTTVAAIPGLSNVYDHEVKGKGPKVQKAYDKRIAGGKKIAEDMVNISNKLGSRMMGLENCFKGGESTARKIDKVKKKYPDKNLTDEEAFAMMDDVVRFSYKCDHGKMVEQIAGLEKELKNNGYQILEQDNKFLPDEKGSPKTYKAVHLSVLAPNGEVFECQIQSDKTLKAKNKNHMLYEKQRVIDTKEHPEMQDEYDRLERNMIENTADVPDPPGIMDLPTIKKKK